MSEVAMALLGSGEFEPWTGPVDRWLLARSRNPDGVALVAPTASAHEGEASFAAWGAKGVEHYASIDVTAEVLPLRHREDAHRDEVVRRLDDASFVFFSGGNPARLAEAVGGTPFWDALTSALADGLPYAGCSAGVACLTERTYDSDADDLDAIWKPGIGFARGVLFGPHWDVVDTWRPGASQAIVGSVRDGQVFVGLDEDTAMVGDGRAWSVLGRRSVHVLRTGSWAAYAEGDVFDLELRLGEGS
ncbi:MAG: Type 1 glutamine amidotransferase-like domain-containing protein [Actinomycetota bacterium]